MKEKLISEDLKEKLINEKKSQNKNNMEISIISMNKNEPSYLLEVLRKIKKSVSFWIEKIVETAKKSNKEEGKMKKHKNEIGNFFHNIIESLMKEYFPEKMNSKTLPKLIWVYLSKQIFRYLVNLLLPTKEDTKLEDKLHFLYYPTIEKSIKEKFDKFMQKVYNEIDTLRNKLKKKSSKLEKIERWISEKNELKRSNESIIHKIYNLLTGIQENNEENEMLSKEIEDLEFYLNNKSVKYAMLENKLKKILDVFENPAKIKQNVKIPKIVVDFLKESLNGEKCEYEKVSKPIEPLNNKNHQFAFEIQDPKKLLKKLVDPNIYSLNKILTILKEISNLSKSFSNKNLQISNLLKMIEEYIYGGHSPLLPSAKP